MQNTVKTIGIFVVVAIVLFLAFNAYIYDEKQGDTVDNYKDATYVIDGKHITLNDGVSEMEVAPGSASKIITRYFGNEVAHDFDADGREDIVFLLTQETGGSGIFYYVVVALDTKDGYIGSQGLLLGDRIAPQTTEMSQNPRTPDVVIVNYADQAPGEPFSTPPSIGKSIWLKLDIDTLQFGEVEQNFEGEADPSKMTLVMKTWSWIIALYNDGREVRPQSDKTFTITFLKDGKFSATTDCNAMGGSYLVDGNTLTFSQIYATKKYCEGSQESVFAKLLEDSTSFHLTSHGELIFDLKFDSGSVIFR